MMLLFDAWLIAVEGLPEVGQLRCTAAPWLESNVMLEG